jgi:hypothetical protein
MRWPQRSWPLVALGLLACGARTDPLAFDTPQGGGGATSASASVSSNDSSSASSSVGSSGAGGTGGTTCVPSTEVCNGIDDNCNGQIDEGCATGCADGTREGYLDQAQYPQIAACAGGWTVPGMLDATQPTCGNKAGNDSPNPTGQGCSAADLCAPGFHVCKGASDVAFRSPTGCAGAAPEDGLFFATRQGSTGCAICTLGSGMDPSICNGCSCAADCAQNTLTANDLFGCGSIGNSPGACGALTRTSGNLCSALGSPWSCGNDGCGEANQVTKPSPTGGGVLCCID